MDQLHLAGFGIGGESLVRRVWKKHRLFSILHIFVEKM